MPCSWVLPLPPTPPRKPVLTLGTGVRPSPLCISLFPPSHHLWGVLLFQSRFFIHATPILPPPFFFSRLLCMRSGFVDSPDFVVAPALFLFFITTARVPLFSPLLTPHISAALPSVLHPFPSASSLTVSFRFFSYVPRNSRHFFHFFSRRTKGNLLWFDRHAICGVGALTGVSGAHCTLCLPFDCLLYRCPFPTVPEPH